ncbi:DUF6884 domain-containing protein [Fictibacillus iocasae]|uniref:DUF6884 domain-containing protein n=1 Tax=Fictibacillus iocasae TaxID=2715437 RepID=A0ABW2NS86_9BACL
MKKKIGLLATARKKLPHPAEAKDLYISPLFQKSLSYAEGNYDDYFFYSAKHGLLTKKQFIEPYNVTIKSFSPSEKRAWAAKVVEKLQEFAPPRTTEIHLHGGWVYREFLEPVLKEAGYAYEVPLEGYSIGKQLKWYDDQHAANKK